MLHTDGGTDIARGHACFQLIFCGQLGMGGRGRVNGEAGSIVDICDVVVQFQGIDEATSRLTTGCQLKADQAAIAAA